MIDIKNYATFVKIKPINKGLSNDKKYYVETSDGQRLFLRVTNIKEFDRKKIEYEMMKQAYEFGVPCPKPYDFDLCDGGKSVYSLSEWLDGEDTESLSHMNETEQYNIGVKAGAVLRKIHALPAPNDAEPWDIRFNQKVQIRINLYNQHNLKSENGDKIIKYLNDRQDLLKNRPQTFWHGAYHIGNQMILPNGEVAAIDFNFWVSSHGEPWYDIVAILWGDDPIAHYLTGLINGYFYNNPPLDFFELLSYYLACDGLTAFCNTFLGRVEWLKPEDGSRHMENILRWFDNMNNPIPTWYLKDLYK